MENTRGKICLECVKDVKHSLHFCSQKQTTISVDDDSSDLPLLSEASSSTFSCPFLPTSVEEASSSGSCAGISSVARGAGGLEPSHWLVKYAKSHVFVAF